MNIVITNDASDIAGGENYVLYLAEGLRNKGHSIIISPKENSMLEEESSLRGFKTIPIPYGRNGREFRAIKLMTDKLRDIKIDIIHSNSNSDRTISAFTAKKMNCRNITSVHSCHSIQYNILHRYRNRNLIHHFIADGYSVKDILTKEDKIQSDRITVIHTGIPEETGQFSEEKRITERTRSGISSSVTVIGTVARLVEFKGIDILIDAFKSLKSKNTSGDIKLLIAGDGKLKKELEFRSEGYGLKEDIIFTGYRKDLDYLLSAMDIYVQPSINLGEELFPISVILAKSAGLPVVASDTGDMKYLIRENIDGFLVKPGDINSLKASLLKLINDNELRKNMGRESRENYRKNFTLDIMIDKVLRVYEEVVGKGEK